MEKKEIVRKIVLGVLIVLVLGLSGFIIWDKFIDEKDDKESEKTEEIEDEVSTEEVEDEVSTEELEGFMFEDTYDYSLNGKNHEITYKYYYDECSLDKCGESKYVIRVAAYFDETKVNTNKYDYIFYGSENTGNFEKIREELTLNPNGKYSNPLNEKNTTTLKGKDGKEYLVMAIEYSSDYSISTPDVYIINDDGKIVFQLESNGTFFTLKEEPAKKYNFDGQQFYVEGDKFYYFSGTPDSENICKVSIKVLTFTNDKKTENEIKLSPEDWAGEGEDC